MDSEQEFLPDNETGPEISPEFGNEPTALPEVALMPPVWSDVLATAFFAQMKVLYENLPTRTQANAWERMLMSQPLHDSNDRASVSFPVLHFLVEHPYVSQNTWVLFDAFFGWTAPETYIPPHVVDMIKIVKRETNSRYAMSYEGIPETSTKEKYLFYRRCLRDSAIEDRRDDVRRYYELAMQLCSSDPELNRIAFLFYDGLKHWEQTSVMIGYAWEALTGLLTLRPDFFAFEIKKPEYLVKRGFDTEALHEYRIISKKYPLDLSVLYRRMECFQTLHDKAGATAERALIRSSFSRIQKQLEKDMTLVENKDEIVRLVRTNQSIMDELNAKYPLTPISTDGIKKRPQLLIGGGVGVLVILLLAVGTLYSCGAFGDKNQSRIRSNASYASDAPFPDSVSEPIADFGENIQMRYTNDVFSHTMQYSAEGYLEFKLKSLQRFSQDTCEDILNDVSGFVASRKSSYPDEYVPVLWRIVFVSEDSTEIAYLSDPTRINEYKKYSLAEVWSKES